jgi:hypothetical protein
MEALVTDEVEISEKDIDRIEKGVKAGKELGKVFPRLITVSTTISGDGVTLKVHFSKKEGAPVRYIGGDDPTEAAAVREVDLRKKFHMRASDLTGTQADGTKVQGTPVSPRHRRRQQLLPRLRVWEEHVSVLLRQCQEQDEASPRRGRQNGRSLEGVSGSGVNAGLVESQQATAKALKRTASGALASFRRLERMPAFPHC